jgi:dolichol-phosphate mannosyltransferase
MLNNSWALIIPLANEEADFQVFIDAVKKSIEKLPNGKIFLVVDKASKDNTLNLCYELSKNDPRFITVWAPENRNVVDAYIRGYKEALKQTDAAYILEMDGGLSHDPATLPEFIRHLDEGYDCVFGSRFIKGGSIDRSQKKRVLLSKTGTILSTLLLGPMLKDMTSGYQGFRREIVEKFTSYQLLSKAHFYQTEMRYLLRKYKWIEIPIHYKAPSPRVSKNAIKNSLSTLMHYFVRRITFRPVSI